MYIYIYIYMSVSTCVTPTFVSADKSNSFLTPMGKVGVLEHLKEIG